MFGILLLLLALSIIAILYFLPPPHLSFSDRYPENDHTARKWETFHARPLKNIVVNNETWYYFSGGDGEKVLLFAHGMGGAYDIWWNQILAFEKQFKIIAYTLPPKVNTLEKVKNGILAILQKEKVQQCTVIGTSMGGYIAQYLLQTIPERMEKAVFGNTFPPNDLLRQENRFKRRVLPWLPEIVLYFLSQKHLKNIVLPAAQNNQLLYAVLSSLPFSKQQFINRFDIVTDYFHEKSPKEKKTPLLLIESDNDPLVPATLRQHLKAQFPTARIHTFRQQGHFPYINAAQEYNAVLQHFLTSG